MKELDLTIHIYMYDVYAYGYYMKGVRPYNHPSDQMISLKEEEEEKKKK